MSNDTAAQDLIKKIAKGDAKSFTNLLALYQRKVFGVCYHLTGDVGLAEDLSQETWIRVVQNANSYSPIAPVGAWICRIARNLCLNELKRRNRWDDFSEEEEAQIVDQQESIEDVLSHIQDNQKIQMALSQLPAKQKLVLMIYLSEEKSHAEIAAELSTSVGAVKLLIHRAKDNLKKLLETI